MYIGHPYFGEISSQVLCTFFNGVVVLLLGNMFLFDNGLVLRFLSKIQMRTSLVAQWLRLCAAKARDAGELRCHKEWPKN